MSFLVSPAVEVNEIDLTNVIPALSTSVGGYVGFFPWGPVEQPVVVGSEKDLGKIFGTPADNDHTGRSFHTAASFLKYGNNLKVVRAVPTGALNAGVDETGYEAPELIKSQDEFESLALNGVYAKFPGEKGNGLTVVLLTAENWTDSSSTPYKGNFEYAPGTTEWAEALTGEEILDEVHVLIVDSSGEFSGRVGTVLEKYQGLSLAKNAKDGSGAANYYGDILNRRSEFVFVAGLESEITNTVAPIVLTSNSTPLDLIEGTNQVETATIVAPSGATTAGNLNVVVTSALVTGSPLTVPVALTLGDTTASAVATKVRAALNATAAVTAHFTVGGTGATYSLTALVKADNDASLNLAHSNDTSVGITTANSSANTTAGVASPLSIWTTVDGADGSYTTASSIVTALEIFEDPETIDINFLFAHAFNESATYTFLTEQGKIDSKIDEIAAARKDIVAFISAPLSIVSLTEAQKLTKVLEKFNMFNSNNYMVFDSTPVQTYNKYTDAFIWIPAAGHIAGLCAYTDQVAEPWFSPGGFNRGNLRGVSKLAFNPKVAQRDELYKARINPIVSVPGQGTAILFGDKTAQTKPSAFDRINVRRLFITMEKAIATFAKFQLFELNDEFTRSSFKNTVEPYLRDIKGRRGVLDYRVICDETNNTSEVIDNNQFVGDIYIKPARSINFIKLNFISTRTGVEFKELVGED